MELKQGDQVVYWNTVGQQCTGMVYSVYNENGWDLVKMVGGEVVPVDNVSRVEE